MSDRYLLILQYLITCTHEMEISNFINLSVCNILKLATIIEINNI